MENKRQAVRQVVIDTGHEGQRVDNYLLACLKGVPKSRIYRLLRKGEVRVNKGRIKPSYRLKSGDIVRIPPIITNLRQISAPSAQLADVILKSILFEDENLLILNKPPGIAVHGGSGINIGVIEALRALRTDIPDLALVHRLDRATSGCLIFAKNRETLLELHKLLRTNEVDKRYVVLLKGEWRYGEHRVDMPLSKNRMQSGERMVCSDAGGKTATSHFRPVKINSTASLMEVKLITGRMHQIRVHAAQKGYPVVGDDKYGDRAFNREMRKFGLSRLFLHAHIIEFKLKGKDQKIIVKAPLPEDLGDCLGKLKLSDGRIQEF